MKNKTTILLLTLFLFGGLSAQSKHEFSANIGTGLSGLNSKLIVGEHNLKFGGFFGAGYRYFFSSKMGLTTGIEFGFLNSKSNLTSFNDRYMTRDMEGTEFEFRTTLSDHLEQQRVVMLQIPVMGTYKTNFKDKKYQFFASAGIKMGLPLTALYSTTVTMINSGYFAFEDYEYTRETDVGFGTFSGRILNGKLDLGLSFMASTEFGVKWILNNRMPIYTGIYFDYGLNNIATGASVSTGSTPTSPIVLYNSNNPTQKIVNSVINSHQGQRHIAEKVSPLSVGITVRVTINKKQLTSLQKFLKKTDTRNKEN